VTLITSNEELLQLNTPANQTVVEGVFDFRSQYVDLGTGAVIARPPSSVTVAQSGSIVTLSAIAMGTIVQISGDTNATITQDALDGQLEITFTASGSYVIIAEQFPEQLFTLHVTL
jgi:hypothetical protein